MLLNLPKSNTFRRYVKKTMQDIYRDTMINKILDVGYLAQN